MAYRMRRILGLAAVAFLGAGLAACGGSSGSQSGGGDTVRVSLASSPQAPASLAPATGTAAPGGSALDNVDHVWITVTGVALLPGDGTPPGSAPSPEFEMAAPDDGAFARGYPTASIPPMTIDLLNIAPGTGAIFLNALDNVPAGTYGKIRLYYSNPQLHIASEPPGTVHDMHSTGHGHLDIHFVGGDLVVPVEADGGGVRIHDVTITFVLGREGLKITRAGMSGNYNMRPQVFATAGDVQYVVSGVVSDFDNAAGTFTLTTAEGRAFPAAYDLSTGWFYREGMLWVSVDPVQGISAMRDGATVDVLGLFDGGVPPVLRADDVLITFPDAVAGTVSSAGFLPDNTFLVFDGTDNVSIVPMPDRAGAFYDGLGDGGIVQDAEATARGYLNGDGSLGAFWITVGP